MRILPAFAAVSGSLVIAAGCATSSPSSYGTAVAAADARVAACDAAKPHADDADKGEAAPYQKAKCLLREGDDEGARAAIASLPASSPRRQYFEARLLARAGKPAEALAALEAWAGSPAPSVYALLEEPDFASLYGDPRFFDVAVAIWRAEPAVSTTAAATTTARALAIRAGRPFHAGATSALPGSVVSFQGYVRQLGPADSAAPQMELEVVGADGEPTGQLLVVDVEAPRPAVEPNALVVFVGEAPREAGKPLKARVLAPLAPAGTATAGLVRY